MPFLQISGTCLTYLVYTNGNLSCYELLLKPSFFQLISTKAKRQLRLSNLKVTSAKTCIFSVNFRPRLAVSKWIVPRPFLIGGVLGYPTSFLVDTWQAKVGTVLPLQALYTWQAKDIKSPKRSCRYSKCKIGTLDYFRAR